MQLISNCMKSISDKIIYEALTYDDVLLVPGYSKVLPRDVSIKSKFSKNIPLNIPIVSAAMDTVTESRMAIAIAQEGGIGVIHKNMPIKKQAEKIRRVKRAESGMIMDPVTLPMNSKVSDAKKSMKENKIGGIPIVDNSGLLKGIVTNRDMRFEKKDDKLTNNKNGNVILVRLIAISNFSVSSLKPGAINATNNGIKISIIKTIASKDKKRILKILFANDSALFLPLFNSEE